MNSKKFSEAMSELDSKYVNEAINYKKKAKKPILIKWGTMAACLCLIVAGIAVISQHDFRDFGTGSEYGGEGQYSVAVFPATEKIEDVATEEVVSLSESEALDNALAKHLPTQLPNNFHYGCEMFTIL